MPDPSTLNKHIQEMLLNDQRRKEDRREGINACQHVTLGCGSVCVGWEICVACVYVLCGKVYACRCGVYVQCVYVCSSPGNKYIGVFSFQVSAERGPS